MSTQTSSGTELKKGRLGVFGIVFFVVAASAPLVGMTGAVPVAMLAGNGAAVPGTYLAVGLTLLLFSVGYAAMSQKVTNAGAFFAYVGRGLGTNMGVGSAFTSILTYVTIQLAIYGFFGGLVAGTAAGYLGIDLPWYVWSILAWVVVTGLSLMSVDVGAKVLGVFLVLELAALLTVAGAILFSGGPSGIDFVASFDPAAILAGGFTGAAGIAIAFALASFIGFEATAIYGEESANPKKTVPFATYWAIGIITALFAIVSFAMVTGYGMAIVEDETYGEVPALVSALLNVTAIDGVPLANPAALLFDLTATYVGPWLVSVMEILVISSLFAGLLAFQNAGSRYFFALGRGGVLPAALGKVNGRGAPQGGVFATSALALIVMVAFAIAGLDPILNLFFWMSSITAVSVMAVEILVSIAIFRFFRKEGGGNVWKTTIAPLASAVLLTGGMYLVMARFNLLSGLAAEGVDPSLPESSFALSPLGWFLVLLPFITLVVGYIAAVINTKENDNLVKDLVS
ncbi:amino acid/polyamine/organocation transporter (APC superfamily) [Microbacteriaceae bacterium MWH-Ta3]|nr:amino acid/polyamine/organocation transporter (APC superfamily) [Microbacteriaceae bacterium MWH-Ta3]